MRYASTADSRAFTVWCSIQFSLRRTKCADESDVGFLAAALFHRTPAPNSTIASTIPAMISSTLMTVSRFIWHLGPHSFLQTGQAQDRRSAHSPTTLRSVHLNFGASGENGQALS